VAGWRPIAEVQYSDFLATGFDQLVNQAAKIRLMSGGKISVPMVLRAPIGARVRGAQHDQCPEAWCMHTPGLKVAIPSTAYDAKGLLKSAIRDDNPVVFFEHKLLYGNRSASAAGKAAPGTPTLQRAAGPEVPEDEYLVPLGVAAVQREGDDVTVVATALMVHKALEAADQLQETGISVEVIDPRTLVPLDKETILKSVQKTGRALVVTEETRTASCAAELSAMIAEEAFDYLDAPVARLCTMDLPLPFAPLAQKAVLPDNEAIRRAITELVR
jgi:pyruvate dehydrogenase E1 component beta subunit